MSDDRIPVYLHPPAHAATFEEEVADAAPELIDSLKKHGMLPTLTMAAQGFDYRKLLKSFMAGVINGHGPNGLPTQALKGLSHNENDEISAILAEIQSGT